MNPSLEPGKTGDPKLDQLLSQAKQEPLQVNLDDIANKVNKGEVRFDSTKTKFRLGNQNGTWRALIIGAGIIAVIALVITKFSPGNKNEVSNVTPPATAIKNETASEKTGGNLKIAEKKPVEDLSALNRAAKTEGTATVNFRFENKPITVVLNSVKVFDITIGGTQVPEEEFANHTAIINQAYEEAGIKHRDVAPSVLEREVLTKKLADVIEAAYPSLKDSAYVLVITAKSSKLNDEEVTLPIHQSLINTYQKATGHPFATNGRIRIEH